MSGPTVSSWAKIAAHKAAPSNPIHPVTQQTSASASTTSASKDDAASTSAATSAPASVTEVNEASKVEAQEATTNPVTDLKKTLAAATFADEMPTSTSAVTPRDEEASVAGSLATSAERNTKSSNSSSRGHDDSNSRKSRKPKRSRNAEKEEREYAEKSKLPEPEPVKIVELREAAVPTVNVWTKRKEAQAAAKKQIPATIPATPTLLNGTTKSSTSRNAAGAAAPATETSGTNGSAAGSSKPQRQPAETPRINGDQQAKRNAPRGSRVAEKEEKPVVNGAVPPVDDATSWPTPATTIEEKKPKAAPIKNTEDESNHSRPAQKPTWQSLDFVPTAKFITPLPNHKASKPRGGGRGGRETGGRGGHSGPAGTQQPADKTATGPVTGNPKGSESWEKKEAPGASTQAPNSAKRVSSEAGNTREQRKSVSPPSHDRSGDHPVTDAPADSKKADPIAKGARHEHVNGEVAPLPRNSVGRTSSEYSAHSGFSPSKDVPQSNRERGEGRGERGGRGGAYRRGGAHGSHATQGHVPQPQYTFNGPRFASNPVFPPQAGAPSFSSPPPQFGYGGPPAPKHGRGNARSQSVSTAVPYANQGVGSRNMPPRMASLQTQGSGYYDSQYPMGEHGQQYPMSAGPVPYAMGDHMADLLLGVQTQVEYYFSADNLAKDLYLREHMDSQGFATIEFIGDFPRLKQLVPNRTFLVTACANSEKLDVVTSDHRVEFIRARNIWDSYVLPEDKRDPSARHNGLDLNRAEWKSTHAIHAPTYNYYPPQAPMPHMYTATSPTAMGGYPPMTNGADEMYPSFTNGVRVDTMTNGNGTHGAGPQNESQLSATVPDFSPGALLDKGITLEEFQTISDADVEKMTVDVPEVVENGTHGSSPEGSSDEQAVTKMNYPDFRARAYDARLAAQPGATPLSTRQLYFWWAATLSKDFNISMYEAFRSLAMEDAKFETPRVHGILNLIAFYKDLMEGKPESPYPTDFIPHREEAERLLNVVKPVLNGLPQN